MTKKKNGIKVACSPFQLQNELDTQRRATEFALRKRSHQEEQARSELEWQIKNVGLPKTCHVRSMWRAVRGCPDGPKLCS